MKSKSCGKVSEFNENTGRGKIRRDDGRIFCVNYRAISGSGFRFLWEGQMVLFEVEGGNAKNVFPVDIHEGCPRPFKPHNCRIEDKDP